MSSTSCLIHISSSWLTSHTTVTISCWRIPFPSTSLSSLFLLSLRSISTAWSWWAIPMVLSTSISNKPLLLSIHLLRYRYLCFNVDCLNQLHTRCLLIELLLLCYEVSLYAHWLLEFPVTNNLKTESIFREFNSEYLLWVSRVLNDTSAHKNDHKPMTDYWFSNSSWCLLYKLNSAYF